MAPEALEGGDTRRGFDQALARRGREQDLSAVAGRADTGGRMHRDPDVARLSERGPASVHADADAHVGALRPRALPERALDLEGRVERAQRLSEDREELIRPRVHLVAVRTTHAGPDDRPYVAQEDDVPVSQPVQKARRTFDVREEEGHGPARQARDVDSARLDLSLEPLFAELPVEEPDRNDSVFLRRSQEPLPRAFARGIILEGDLIEPRQGVPDVRGVVDRQAPAALRIDVCE